MALGFDLRKFSYGGIQVGEAAAKKEISHDGKPPSGVISENTNLPKKRMYRQFRAVFS
jgi:hypothetical protein